MVSPIFGNTWNPNHSAAPEADPQAPNASVVAAPGLQRTGRSRTRVASRPARGARARRFRVTRGMLEGALMVFVMALAIVVAGTAIGEAVLRPKSAPVIAVKVQPGDTLWSLADRYGYPSDYILKRVDRLATYNNLPAGARLQPGQVLQVPVENPAEQQRILVSTGSAE